MQQVSHGDGFHYYDRDVSLRALSPLHVRRFNVNAIKQLVDPSHVIRLSPHLPLPWGSPAHGCKITLRGARSGVIACAGGAEGSASVPLSPSDRPTLDVRGGTVRPERSWAGTATDPTRRAAKASLLADVPGPAPGPGPGEVGPRTRCDTDGFSGRRPCPCCLTGLEWASGDTR